MDDLTSSVKGHVQGWIDALGELLHGLAKQELDNLCELFEVSYTHLYTHWVTAAAILVRHGLVTRPLPVRALKPYT